LILHIIVKLINSSVRCDLYELIPWRKHHSFAFSRKCLSDH